jgi:tRNA pseudouridine55 synthase
VDQFQITRIELPEVDFIVNCTKGFYVRTYAHDIGEKLGCGAHLSALRRTRSGKFTLDRAVPVADLKTTPTEELVKRLVSLAEISLMRGA